LDEQNPKCAGLAQEIVIQNVLVWLRKLFSALHNCACLPWLVIRY